jgi:hypothetical protein
MNYHVWQRRFIATVHSQQRLCSKIQLLSLESLRTFRTEDQDVMCTGNEGADHQVELEDNCVFRVHEDTTLEVIHHMLKSGRKSGRKVRKSEDCDGKEKSSRRRLALRSTCASGPVMSNGPTASEDGDNVQVAKELDTPCHEQWTLCVQRQRRRPSNQRAGHSPMT